MYIRDFWASLARRWYLAVACLLATVGLVYAVSQQVPPTYESTADVVLVPPKSSEDPTANRYLSLGGLRQAVDVLTRSLGSDSTKDQVRKVAPDGKYEAMADFTTSAPILIVKVEAGSPAAAQKLLDAILKQVPANLGDLQDKVDIDSKFQITPQMVASDEKPKAVTKKQIRAVGAIGALCLLLSAMLIAAVDNLALRRVQRRLDAEETEPTPARPPTGPAQQSKRQPVTQQQQQPKQRPKLAPQLKNGEKSSKQRSRDVVSAKARR